MSRDKPTPEDILEVVRDAGLLFEQEIASLVEGLAPKWSVITNRGFQDPDDLDKSREIDVWCYRPVDISIPNTSFSASLLVECKHSSTPFVFMTRPTQEFDGVRQPALRFPLTSYRVPTGPNQYQERQPLHRFSELRGLHWASTGASKGVYFGRMARKGGSWELVSQGMTNSIVFPLVKAMVHFQGKRQARQQLIPPNMHTGLSFHFLLVVVDSPIYAIDGTSADPEPIRMEHIRFARELSTQSIPDETYSIDFVHRDYLESFIQKTLNPYLTEVAGFFERHPDALRDPEFAAQ